MKETKKNKKLPGEKAVNPETKRPETRDLQEKWSLYVREIVQAKPHKPLLP